MTGWADLPPVTSRFLGRVPYGVALAAQRERRDAVVADPSAPEALWFVEHPPVITTGLRQVADLPSERALAERGIALVRTERGGLATYHGPGQLVGYAILRLRPRGLTVPALVRALESGVASWLEGRGAPCELRRDAPGVWCAAGKIASVGVHVRKGVSMHGFALNLDVDLEPFTTFRPCGLDGVALTNLRALGLPVPPLEQAASELSDHVMWSLLASSVDTAGAPR